MIKRYSWLLGCLGFLLFGAGCIRLPSVSFVTPPPPKEVFSTVTSTSFIWEKIGAGFDRVETKFSSTTGAVVVLYRLSSKQFKARLAQTLPPKHVSVWGAEVTSTSLLVNGVYFQEDYLPAGFFQVSGTRIGNRAFDQDKSGALLFDPWRIIDTKAHPVRLGSSLSMAQSYPFLVKNGMLAVAEESGKLARRTFVGVDRDGLIYVGVAPYAPLTLFQLGQFLTHLPIAWLHVLNLDGGPSTGLWMHQGTRSELFDSYVPVPNILFFQTK